MFPQGGRGCYCCQNQDCSGLEDYQDSAGGACFRNGDCGLWSYRELDNPVNPTNPINPDSDKRGGQRLFPRRQLWSMTISGVGQSCKSLNPENPDSDKRGGRRLFPKRRLWSISNRELDNPENPLILIILILTNPNANTPTYPPPNPADRRLYLRLETNNQLAARIHQRPLRLDLGDYRALGFHRRQGDFPLLEQ